MPDLKTPTVAPNAPAAEASPSRLARRKLSRRKFVTASALTGAGTLAGAALPSKARAQAAGPVRRAAAQSRAIIIGSGFGGAVAALRLTERGVETMLLERGRRWPIKPNGDTFSAYIPPDKRSTWLATTTRVPFGPPLPVQRYVGVLDGVDMGGLRIMSGAAYGGGSITYGGLHVKPKQELFELVYPAEISYAEMQPYYQRFADRVGISAAPDDVYQSRFFTHYRVVEEQTVRAGLTPERIESATDWDIVRKEIDGSVAPSAVHGEAIYGVNSGAKKSLDHNYLRDAEATGLLEVKTQHIVTEIGQDASGKYEVFASIIADDGTVLERVSYLADYLFLAAGTIGTNSLLVKAKAKQTLPRLNDEIGAGFGNNGNVYCLRTVPLAGTGQWQGGPPALGIDDRANPISPLFIEHPQFPLGVDLRSLMFFGVGINPTRGRFYYDAASDSVKLDWPRRGNKQDDVNRAMLHTMRKLNAYSGGVINPLLFGGPLKDDSVYHPLGGAVLGKACDFYGRVKEYDRLYVMDAAALPGSTACANPSFTVAAMAERNMERVLAEDF